MSPRYDVVIWHKPQPDLSSQLVARAGRAPDEGCETVLGGDLHWSIDNGVDAIKCAESFFEFAAFDGVTYLAVTGYVDEEFGHKVFKDTRTKKA